MGNQPWPQFQNGIQERSILNTHAVLKADMTFFKSDCLNMFSLLNCLILRSPIENQNVSPWEKTTARSSSSWNLKTIKSCDNTLQYSYSTQEGLFGDLWMMTIQPLTQI